MNYVWIEWICRRCNELHRTKFQIVTSLLTAKKVKGILQKEGGYIEDSVAMPRGTKAVHRRGSKVFVKLDTDISKIFSMLEHHMLEYYAIEEGSLSMDVCRE